MEMKNNVNIHKSGWGKSIFNYGKWYFLSSILTKGLSVLLLPIYTRYLNPTDYGILQSLNSIALFLPVLLSLSLDSAFGRFFHNYKHSNKQLKLLFSTVFWFVVVYGSLVLFLIFLTSKYWVTELLTVPVFPYVYLAFIPALLTQLAQLGKVFLEQSLQAQKTTLLDVISAILNAGISIWLLIGFHLGVIGRLWGGMVSAVFLVIFYVFYFYRIGYLKFIFSKKLCRQALKYAVPLVPAMAGSWIAGLSDRLVIAKYCTLADVGLYSLAFQLAMILYLIGDAITRVLGPITMSGLVEDKENVKKKMADYALILWTLMLVLNLGIALFAKEFVALISDKAFSSSYSLIAVISFIYVLGMQYRFPMTVISYYNKTWIISTGSVFMGITNLIFNLIFVPIYGYVAAAWATNVSMLLFTLWLFFWGQKLEKVQYKWKRYIQVFGVFSISIVLSVRYLNNEMIDLFSFLCKCGIFFITSLIMVYFTDRNIFQYFLIKKSM